MQASSLLHLLLPHVLCVAGVNHCNRVALDGVGVVPLVGVCHVVARPSADDRATARQRTLYGVDGEESVAHVLASIFFVVLWLRLQVCG